jgi:very-short-patch-repair endonuclease
MPGTLSAKRRKFLRTIGRRGGLKRAEAFTSDYQRMARSHVSHKANVANGRKGGTAYIQKHGKRRLVEQARRFRLAHPSDLEQIVERTLMAIGATDYEREAYIFPRSRSHHNTGDFVFRKRRRIVYADGAAWHNGKGLHPSLAECTGRAMRDEKLDSYLRDRGWKVLRLPEQEIRDHARGRDGGAMQRKLGEFLAKSCGSENGSQTVRQA